MEWYKNLPPLTGKKHKASRCYYQDSIRVLCVVKQKSGERFVKEGFVRFYFDTKESTDLSCYNWKVPGTIDQVTHWAYLPPPPPED